MKDDPDHGDDPAFRQVCQRIVRDLSEKYGWTLLHQDDLVEPVLATTQPGASPGEVEKLTLHHYTIAWYEACQQDENPERREQAYTELYRFLFRAACKRWPDLAEDVTQRALILVYEQLGRCRDSGTFLAFALFKLWHAFQQEQRARGKELLLEEEDWCGAEDDQGALPSQWDEGERLQVLLDAIARLPRELERKTIIHKFFQGLSDEEIGQRLGITPNHVRVLRHRGLERLRKDEQLRDYVEARET